MFSGGRKKRKAATRRGGSLYFKPAKKQNHHQLAIGQYTMGKSVLSKGSDSEKVKQLEFLLLQHLVYMRVDTPCPEDLWTRLSEAHIMYAPSPVPYPISLNVLLFCFVKQCVYQPLL